VLRQQAGRLPPEGRGALEPFLGIHDDSFGVDPENRRYAALQTIAGGGFLPIEQHALLELLVLDESFDDVVIFIPGIDGQNCETFAGVLDSQLAEVRSLRTAGRSPIGEKGQDHRLAPQLAETHGFSLHIAQIEVWGRLSHQVACKPPAPRRGTPRRQEQNQKKTASQSVHACTP